MVPVLLGLAGVVAKIVKSDIDASVKKRQSDNEMKTKVVKYGIGGVVAWGVIQAAHDVLRNNAATEISTPHGSIKTIRDKSVAHAMIEAGFVPSLESARVDTQSVWCKRLNKGATQLGANMIDNQTGTSHHVQYFIEPAGDAEYEVYESVDDGNWEHKGHVDQKRMSMSDLSSDAAGGPVFGYLARLAKNTLAGGTD